MGRRDDKKGYVQIDESGRIYVLGSGLRKTLGQLAGIVMGYYAPRRPILNGVLLGVPVALAFGVVNLIDEHLGGYRTFPGISGMITVMVLFLPFSLPVSALGALIGTRLADRKSANPGFDAHGAAA